MDKTHTVGKRIFISNTIMMLVTLSLFLIINVFFMKLYFYSVEQEMIVKAGQVISGNALGELIEDWTIHNNNFLILFLVDGMICIVVLMMVSQFFTKNLTAHIMKPLNILSEATKRIKNNDLSTSIEYIGELEFEDICNTFNEMQQHLLEAQIRNKKYEKARTDMIAGISHDLKTPLTVIKGSLKAILDGIASEVNQKVLIQKAYHRTEDMNMLLDQLFYISKLTTGDIPKQCELVNISDYLQTYLNTTKVLLDEEKEILLFEDHGIHEELYINIDQLHRVLDNLVENSKKYACANPLEMKIELKRESQWIDICFFDNGVGVSKEKLPFIFDEFYQADPSRNTKEGNGLGLYIVKCLIENMKGIVEAESRDGLHIHVKLPVSHERMEDDEQ